MATNGINKRFIPNNAFQLLLTELGCDYILKSAFTVGPLLVFYASERLPIVGALIGGWLIGPLLRAGTINDGITIMSFIVSLIGAVVLLAILSFFRRSSTS